MLAFKKSGVLQFVYLVAHSIGILLEASYMPSHLHSIQFCRTFLQNNLNVVYDSPTVYIQMEEDLFTV